MILNRKGKVKKIPGFFILFFLLCIIGVNQGFSKKLASFKELTKVEMLRVNYDRFFVVEDANIYIYSLKDFKLIKKFGKKGEGPQEFKINSAMAEPLTIEIQPGYISVNSVGKVSLFTLDGEFIKEEKANNARWFLPLGKNFVGNSFAMVNNTLFRTINIYDAGLKKIKEIYREEFYMQLHKGQKVLMSQSDDKVKVLNDRIFVSGKEGFVFNIYDNTGKLLHTIKREHEKRKFKDIHKKLIKDYFRLEHNKLYTLIKDKIEFPEHFPAFHNFYPGSRYLYIESHIEKDEKVKFLIYDPKGELIKQVFLPLFRKSLVDDFPLDFYEGKLYQMVENEKTQDWELHVIDIPIK